MIISGLNNKVFIILTFDLELTKLKIAKSSAIKLILKEST